MAFQLQDELQALQEPERYQIPDSNDIESMEEGDLDALLEGAR